MDLCTLIEATGSSGGSDYSNIKTVGPKFAAYPNENSTTFVPFYKEPKAANLIEKSDFNTQTGWNREHTWPKSRGGSLFEGDPVVIRPAAVADNSNRGNSNYGLAGAGWDPACCGYEDARGASARIILYAAVAYHAKGVSLNNEQSGSKTMGTLKTLLKWNREYAPTEWEKTVNNRTDKGGYRRNPFVDHPEFAEWIWDDNGIRNDLPDIDAPDTPVDPVAPSLPDGTEYIPVTDASNLDGASVAIITSNSGVYYGMTSEAKSSTLPFYLNGDPITNYDGRYFSEKELERFTLDKQTNGKYVISNEGGDTLYGYKCTGSDGKAHYSIGIGSSPEAIKATQPTSTFDESTLSDEWTITAVEGGYKVGNGTVYLEYYKGSFCGYQNAPSDPIIFAL